MWGEYIPRSPKGAQACLEILIGNPGGKLKTRVQGTALHGRGEKDKIVSRGRTGLRGSGADRVIFIKFVKKSIIMDFSKYCFRYI